ncbi:MAG: response regulator transcription factor [Paenibacillaceae bacterium]|uniref:response regulator transcription factor n=1 Tax=Paenibacillus cymbidii TaxID=1639034 RepID=UPI001080617F|nr:response regulator transcription factor [Paenibacillus cymbidii]MBO9607763.1 response regulator transcription factor [Paenibacillaceae bacterium]
MHRIIIADDQRLLRDGLQTILNLEDDMEVVSVAQDGQEACRVVRELRPDIVLMDIKMPIMDGIEAMRRIKRDVPGTVVLMLTTFAEDKFIVDAMSGGADGFLLKDMPAEKVVQTVRDAMAGQLMLPAPIAAKLAARLAAFVPSGADTFDDAKIKSHGLVFTERERKIILLLIDGYSNKQIAAALFMTEGTVRNYVSVIYNKIGTNDRQAAIVLLKELLLDGTL